MSYLDLLTNGDNTRECPVIVVHGTRGSWKTQLAIDNGGLILQTENGLGDRSADGRCLPITSFAKLMTTLDEIEKAAEFPFPVLNLDSLDHLIPLIDDVVLQGSGKTSIAEMGWNKGKDAQTALFWKMLKKIVAIRDKFRIPILLLAHSEVKTVNMPNLDEVYQTVTLKLPKGVGGVLEEKADILTFSEEVLSIVEKDERKRVTGAGQYRLCWQQNPAYSVKNRYRISGFCKTTWADMVQKILKG